MAQMSNWNGEASISELEGRPRHVWDPGHKVPGVLLVLMTSGFRPWEWATKGGVTGKSHLNE